MGSETLKKDPKAGAAYKCLRGEKNKGDACVWTVGVRGVSAVAT